MERLTAKYQKRQRISPRDIGVILNKIMKEKKTEGLKEEDNIDSEKNYNQEQQQQQHHHHLSLSTQSYKPLHLNVILN
jgi:hypothetical protein